MKWKHLAAMLTSMLAISSYCWGQVSPFEAAILNYRLIGFSVPPKEKTTCLLEIAEGVNNNEYFFKRNTIISKTAENGQIIATVPDFGKAYTWRVSYLNSKNKAVSKTPLQHFTTDSNDYIDPLKYRLHILQADTTHVGLHVFVDATRALYNIKGDPVWFLPEIPGIVSKNTVVRDLKITGAGTITFLADNKPFEISYDGKVLWSAPDNGKLSADTNIFYHHEFTRLSNGNYMVAGNENVLIPAADSNMLQKRKNNQLNSKMLCGTIIEYDRAGNIAWLWKSSEYFLDKSIFFRKKITGGYAKTHLNGFYLDEKDQMLYVSFRDISTILKISYPDKKVLAAYGMPNSDTTSPILFHGQHSCRINHEGNLYLFNNNALLKQTNSINNTASTVLILKESMVKDSAVKIWEFSCDIDTLADHKAYGGGSVYELSDNSILVSMGTINRLFIVSAEKKLLWNALIQIRNNNKGWESFPSYRTSAVETNEQLEKIIFRDIKK